MVTRDGFPATCRSPTVNSPCEVRTSPWGEYQTICGRVVRLSGRMTLHSRVNVCPATGAPSWTMLRVGGRTAANEEHAILQAPETCLPLSVEFHLLHIPSSCARPVTDPLTGPSPAVVLAEIATETSWYGSRSITV